MLIKQLSYFTAKNDFSACETARYGITQVRMFVYLFTVQVTLLCEHINHLCSEHKKVIFTSHMRKASVLGEPQYTTHN